MCMPAPAVAAAIANLVAAAPAEVAHTSTLRIHAAFPSRLVALVPVQFWAGPHYLITLVWCCFVFVHARLSVSNT